jgi:CRP-like cAMP-binding protein
VIRVHSRDDESGGSLHSLRVAFNKEAAIYHEGDPAEHWYQVDSGMVRTCRFLADGHRQLTGFFYPGDVFGLDKVVYQESAEAVTNTVLRCHSAESISEGDLQSSQAPDQVLHKALESARRSIFLFGHRTAANRVAAFLIEVAERSGERARLELPMTRSDIADHLNLTLHTVSRTISDFGRKGLIALHGPQMVRILDLDNLRLVAGDADAVGTARVSSLYPSFDQAETCESA